jgi:hypothetical protein
MNLYCAAPVRVEYQLPAACHVLLEVFDVTGKHIQTLVNAQGVSGVHAASWNTGEYPAGVYLYRLTAGEFRLVKRGLIIK